MPNTVSPPWTLGDRIRKAREVNGMRQTDLADRLQIARSTLAGWENDVHRPSHSDLRAIASFCESVPLDWLEYGTDNGPDEGTVNPREWEDIADGLEWADRHNTCSVNQLTLELSAA